MIWVFGLAYWTRYSVIRNQGPPSTCASTFPLGRVTSVGGRSAGCRAGTCIIPCESPPPRTLPLANCRLLIDIWRGAFARSSPPYGRFPGDWPPVPSGLASSLGDWPAGGFPANRFPGNPPAQSPEEIWPIRTAPDNQSPNIVQKPTSVDNLWYDMTL